MQAYTHIEIKGDKYNKFLTVDLYCSTVFLFIAMAVTVVDTSYVDSSDLIFPSSKLQSEATNVTLSNTIEIPLASLSAIAKLSGMRA